MDLVNGEVEEAAERVSDVGAEACAHDAVPRGSVGGVKLLEQGGKARHQNPSHHRWRRGGALTGPRKDFQCS